MPPKPASLFSRDFRLWLGARFLSNLSRNLVVVALAWQIYRATGDPLALGLIGLVEAVPFLAVSLWAGHLVDRHHKKPFMLGAEAVLSLCAALFFALTFLPAAPLPLLYAVVALGGVGVSFGSVASSVFVQITVPGPAFSRAAAWNLACFTTAAIAGPLLSGWILAAASARHVYGLAAGLFLISLALVAALRAAPPGEPSEEPPLRRIREGVRFVLSQPIILACMSLDMVAVLFGDAVALFPIFADLMKAGPFGFGVLRSAPAAGAALVSVAQALRPFIRPRWDHLKWAVFLFGLSMIGFALSGRLWLAALLLGLGGAADGVSVIIRQSVYQARTPDALRGRVSALVGIFVSASNEVGAFESGLAARLLGPVGSVLFGGSVTLASVFLLGWKFRRIKED